MLKEKNILFEDNHLLVIYKEAGLLAQGDKTGDESALDFAKQYVKVKYNKPGDVYMGLPHRLDRPVSGVLCLCKTSKAHTRMVELFKERQIKKYYLARVEGLPENDEMELSDFLLKRTDKNRVHVFQSAKKGAKLATLRFNLLGSQGSKDSLLWVEPLSGRSHQIRAQLSNIDCPIMGDLKYGSTKKNKDASISLHAYRLEFLHPVRKVPLRIDAPVPLDHSWGAYQHVIEDIS